MARVEEQILGTIESLTISSRREQLALFLKKNEKAVLNISCRRKEKIFNIALSKKDVFLVRVLVAGGINGHIPIAGQQCESWETDIRLNKRRLKRIPWEVNYFYHLESLQLIDNHIHKIENLDFCINLKKLCLNRNHINKIENLSQCIKLEEIDLSSNDIIKIENLYGLSSLKKICLVGNPVNEIEKNGLFAAFKESNEEMREKLLKIAGFAPRMKK